MCFFAIFRKCLFKFDFLHDGKGNIGHHLSMVVSHLGKISIEIFMVTNSWKTANAIKILFDNFIWKLYQLWGPVPWLLEGWYTRKPWFSRLFENISASFWYFFIKSLLVVRSYRAFVINMKTLIISALVTLETRLKMTILAVFVTIFDDFGHLSSCLFWHKLLAWDTKN